MWVEFSGEPPAVVPRRTIRVQTLCYVCDRFELEAEELADADDILSVLEGEESEQASTAAALLEAQASVTKTYSRTPGVENGTFARDVQMDMDVDPRADEWEDTNLK